MENLRERSGPGKESNAAGKATAQLKASQIVTVFGNKGGIGKSIIACNLAVAAAARYKGQVALVDLDLQLVI